MRVETSWTNDAYTSMSGSPSLVSTMRRGDGRAQLTAIETLDGNGLSLSFPTREAAEIAFRQVRTGSNVQHCALLTHMRDGLYANGATHCRP